MSKDLIVGMQGAGKTTLGIFISRRIMEYVPDCTLYTNMNIKNDNRIKTISDIGEIPLDRSPKILLIDEAMFTLDSRSHSSKNNKVWSRLQALFRKANFLKVIFMTHKLSLIDNRMRDQLDYIYMARKNKTRFEYLGIDLVTQKKKPFYLPKNQNLFTYTNFDTYDFPNPISVDSIQDNTLFKIQK